MRQKFTLLTKTLLLLFALMAGSGSAWADDTYVKVSSESDIVAGGEYILAETSTATKYVANSTFSSSKYGTITSGFTISDDAITIPSTTTNVLVITLGGSKDNWTIYDGSNYVGKHKTSNTNFIRQTSSPTTIEYKWTIKTKDTEYAIYSNYGSYTTRYWGRNNSSTGPYEGNSYPAFVMYKKQTGPAISASDVNYAADITAGSISYSITNPVDGKSLSATTTADWITVGTITSSAVPFTMTENTGSERQGTITLKYDGATDKEVTVTQAAAAAKYAVTITVPSNGTLAVKRGETEITSGTEVPTGTELTIEAAPARGYSLTKWEYKEGDDEWTDGVGTSYTVASSAVAFRATFSEITKYTVTLGDDNSTLTEEYGGEGVTLPTRSVPGNTFEGWVTANISTATTTVPTIISAGTLLLTEDITLYPVYSYSAIGTVTNYKRVSALSEVTEGTYVMGSQKTLNGAPLVYMPNTESSGSNPTLKEGLSEETIVQDVFLSNEITNDMLWDFTSTGTTNQYYIRPHGSTTIGLGCTTTTGANVRISSSYKNMKWTVAESTDYNWQFKNNASTAMYLAVYDKYAWRNYSSSSTNQNGKFYLYKAVDATGVRTYYTSTPVSTGTIALNAACHDGSVVYGTYYTDRAYVMPENMVGQVVKVGSEGKLVVQNAYVEDDIVPVGTALLLYTIDDFTGTKNYTVNYSNESGTDRSSDNMLKGTLTAEETTTGDNCLFYRLTMHNGTQIGFWWGAANGAAFVPGANKAYLAVPAAAAARIQNFWFNDEVSGIGAALVNSEERIVNNEIYNLNGQRVSSPKKGLYIVNGKKVIKN